MKNLFILSIFLFMSFGAFCNDTLFIQAKFSFNKKSSKYFQEPKFIDVDIINNSENDYYFMVPFFYSIFNKTDTIPLSLMKGRFENDLDVNLNPHPKQEELKPFRKEVRKRLKEKNINLDGMFYYGYWKEESDEFYSDLGILFFIKKNSKITLHHLIKNDLDVGNYSIIKQFRLFYDPVYEFFPEKFQCFKYFKGEFVFKNNLEFNVN
jgi:hypothetical protein